MLNAPSRISLPCRRTTDWNPAIKEYEEDWKEAVSIIEEAEQVLNARFKCLDPEKNLESLRAKEGIKLLMLAMNIRVGVERQLYE